MLNVWYVPFIQTSKEKIFPIIPSTMTGDKLAAVNAVCQEGTLL